VKAFRKPILLTALALMAALCRSLAFAQEGTAALNGQITDHDGLAIAGVKVEALNGGTNASYSEDTNEIGLYSFPTVPAGTYNVTATKEGFQQEVRPGVALHVSEVMWNGISALLSFVQLHVG
jgi:carboxypeptidase family protein